MDRQLIDLFVKESSRRGRVVGGGISRRHVNGAVGGARSRSPLQAGGALPSIRSRSRYLKMPESNTNLNERLGKKWGKLDPTPHASGKPFDAVTEKVLGEGDSVFTKMRSALKGALASQTAKKLALYGAGATAIGGGLAAADALKNHLSGTVGKKRALNKVLADNPGLANESPADVQRVFSTLHRFNPDMAGDPLVAGSFVRRALMYKNEGIQPNDVKTLADIRKSVSDAKQRSSGSFLRGIFGDATSARGLAGF